jgi:hypothetical protein
LTHLKGFALWSRKVAVFPDSGNCRVSNVIKFRHLASGIDATVWQKNAAEDCDGNNDQAVG